jgi:predicted DNA-binding transcriptional regulator YafY
MKGIIDLLMTDKQVIHYKICKYLSAAGEDGKSTKDIFEALSKNGIDLNRQSSVLYKYMNTLVEQNIVGHKPKGKTKYYTLKKEYSIIELMTPNPKDAPVLLGMQKALEKYKNLPIYGELDSLIEKYKLRSMDIGFRAIDFETAEEYEGVEYLDRIHGAIVDQETIQFDYQRFEENQPKQVLLEPYLLKEHNRRWYVVGTKPGGSEYKAWPLDRVKGFDWAFEGPDFKRDPGFNPDTHWADSIGIFRGKPEKVSFELRDSEIKNIDFVRTAKIHRTQKIEEIDGKWCKVTLTVFPSYELVREIRKLGIHNLRNVKPKKLDDMLRKG